MRIKNIFLLLAIGGSLILSNALFSSCASKNKMKSSSDDELSSLVGVWQICHKTPSRTNVKSQTYIGKTLKILSKDGTFTNVYFNDKQGQSVITGHGSYRQTSGSTYIESIVNSVNTSLKNDEIEFVFKIVDDNFLHTRFFVKKDGLGNPLNRWYEESYVRVTSIDYTGFLHKMTGKSHSQNKQKSEKESDIFSGFGEGERAPVFTGEGTVASWVSSRLRYPVEAQKAGIEGKVFVRFVIEADGSVTNAKVIRGVDYYLDNEVLRVIKIIPKWKPGMKNGKAVRCSFSMPINFTLPIRTGKK